MDQERIDRLALDAAYEEAAAGWREGGLPIGSALADREGRIVARGHNLRVQTGDPTAHAEMVCLRNAGRRRDWPSLTLATTLSPCAMCSGAATLYRVSRIVIGESETFTGREDWLEAEGFTLVRMRDERCIALMRRLIAEKPDLWAEDIGE